MLLGNIESLILYEFTWNEQLRNSASAMTDARPVGVVSIKEILCCNVYCGAYCGVAVPDAVDLW